MKNIIFQEINYESELYFKAIELRQEVLRTPLGLKYSSSDLKQEADQIHIVCILDEQLIASASLMLENDHTIKLRQVAVRPHLQNLAIGTKLLNYCENYIKKRNYKLIYCHARETALNFYLKNKYEIVSEKFLEIGLPHFKLQKVIN